MVLLSMIKIGMGINNMSFYGSMKRMDSIHLVNKTYQRMVNEIHLHFGRLSAKTIRNIKASTFMWHLCHRTLINHPLGRIK
tara:strand:- start:3 stop:245 length:243 start_codon:yes stop_codon:yes gene_type:complete